jgi:hypothetical protein
MKVSSLLVKVDLLCDYIPLVSTASNLIDLFQKYVVLPFLAKETSNRYYQHLQQKSFFRCIALIIPILGNIIVGIYDLVHRPVYKNPVTLQDIEKVFISGDCAESWPCQHSAKVVLKDGRVGYPCSSYAIWSIISKLAKERINPGKPWSADGVIDHFQKYSKSEPDMGWFARPPEEVLNRIF